MSAPSTHPFRRPGLLAYLAMIFLNAFVDLGHKIVIQNTLFKAYDGDTQIVLTAIVNALILLPFVLLFSPSGWLADRFSKPRVMRTSAWAAVAITLGITAFYYLGWFEAAFAMTFLLAAQSAIYSPAKYGYIKELLGAEQLGRGNAAVQAVTTVAILAGIFVFSVLFEARLTGTAFTTPHEILPQIAPLGWLLVGITGVELVLAYRLPEVVPGDASMRFDMRAYRRGDYLRDNLMVAWRRRSIRLSMLGLAVFWALSQVVLAVFPAFAKDTLGITNTVLIQGLLAATGLGIIAGSMLAGRLSRRHIETGLIPLGALGVSAGLLALPWLDSTTAHAINFLAIGGFGGLLIVPLNALIQFQAPERDLGRVLAANNLVQNVVMLGFLGVTVAAALLHGGSHAIVLALGAIALLGSVVAMIQLPQSLLRFVVAALFSTRYRLRVLGLDKMPASGGVLLLGNHISWIDWAMVQIASPRPVRFVMDRKYYERWYLRWLLERFGVVPISRGQSKDALAAIGAALAAGDVVCLFPEGAISRNGQLGEFKKGFMKAAATVANATDAVIVPFYLRGLWGDAFSRATPRHKRNRGERDVIVAFGAPLPLRADVEQVKQAVTELSIGAWEEHVAGFPTLPEAWLRRARAGLGETALIEAVGPRLSNRRLLTAVLLMARRIRRLDGDTLGILLPAGSAGAIINLAALLAGKAVVNLNFTASPEALRASLAKADIRHVLSATRFEKKLAGKGIDLEAAFDGRQVHRLEDWFATIGKAEKLATLLAASLLPRRWLIPLFGRRSQADDTAAILFSSGSEGTPKGIELSHRNLLANSRQVADMLNPQGDDVMLGNLPLFHAFGLTVTTFMPLLEGIPLVTHPNPTDALGAAKAIAQHRVTLLFGTATFLRLYARNRRIHPLMLDSLRLVVAGAERLGPDVREAFSLKFNKPIYEGYGATETTPVASVNVPDRLAPDFRAQLGNRPGTVGLPLPGTGFRIVDPLTLAPLPAGEDGLILIGGVQVMKGYLGAAEKTAAAIVELDGRRWYRTGDKGHLDADGFLTIVDRYSRFAKLGGEMVSLGAVEQRLRAALTGLSDDPTAIGIAAVNLPDAKKGERIVALVAGAIDLEALRKKLLGDGGSTLGIPSQFASVATLPTLGSGKPDFSAARRLALSLVAEAA